jgi:hypothetical protein
MKILLLSEGRTGSYSVMDWLSLDLKLRIIGEQQPCDYVNQDNMIVKRTLSNGDFNLEDIKYFDKIIVLYRENTLQQAESSLWAILEKKWHHSFGTQDGFYVTDDSYLIENHKEIWDNKYRLDKSLFIYKSLDFGLKISYEDIFDNLIGQKMLEDYIGFTSTTTLALSSNKLRIYNPRQTINSLVREISRINIALENKNLEIGNLYMEINNLKAIIKNKNKLI